MTLFFAAWLCVLPCWLFLITTLSFLDKAQCIQLPPSITTRTYHFNLTLNSLNPDCSNYTNHDTLLINGLMPGPTIIASTGDRILVHFRNKLPRTTGNSTGHNDPRLDANAATLHFHGIHQHGSVKSDGVPFLTQDPVAPGGGHYLYDFLVGEQSGTFYYHAHVGLQDFFGAFIVYESDQANPGIMQQQQLSIKSANSTITYDDERILMLSEWYHRDRSDLESLIIGPDYSRIPDADSLLINGMAIHNQQHPSSSCSGYPTVTVKSHHTYRLRVIGATTYRTLGFAIAHHRFTIIEVDGYLVSPYETDYLEIAPGQRFSVLLKADQPAKAYTIGTNRRYITNKSLLDASKLSKGWAILNYDTMDNSTYYALPHDRPVFPANDTPQWIWNKLTPAGNNDHHMGILSRQPARTIVLNTTSGREIRNGKSVQRFYINNVTYDTPAVSILGQIFNGTRPTSRYTIPQLMMADSNSTISQFGQGYDPELKTYPLEHMEIVDFVIQNTHTPGLPCHQHPWHTHGKSHWVIAYGSGAYNETLHGHIRNVPNPLLKDITVIYPSLDASTAMATPANKNNDRYRQTYQKDETAGCGWSKIRIIADNPGIWALHCHITPHMLQGMMVVLEESPGLIRSHSHLVKLEHRSI